MTALFWLINTVLDIVVFCLFANVIMSWLVAFGIVNIYQPFVRTISDLLNRICTPITQPIRRFIPVFNGVDFSPLIALIAVQFLRTLIMADIRPLFL